MNITELKKIYHSLFMAGFLALASASVLAVPAVTVPNTFTSGGTIIADEMNENFSAVVDGINNIVLTPGPQGEQGLAGTQGSDGGVGSQGPAGADGASCNLSECVLPGEATLACGGTSLLVPCILNNVLDFESTVTAVFNQGGGLPTGVAVDDIVTFSLPVPLASATIDSPLGSCSGNCTIASWILPSTTALLTYSSGHSHTISVDRVEIVDEDSTEFAAADKVVFYNGSTKVYEVTDLSGTLIATPMASNSLEGWMGTISQPNKFKATYYWENWGNWGTYHYDYTKSSPLNWTRVTFTP